MRLPEDIVCSCSSEEDVFFGCADGNVISLDTSLNKQREFQAHATSLLWLYRAHKVCIFECQPHLKRTIRPHTSSPSATISSTTHPPACACGPCSTTARSRSHEAYVSPGQPPRERSPPSPPVRTRGHPCTSPTPSAQRAPYTTSTAMSVRTARASYAPQTWHASTVRERITRAQLKAPGTAAWHTLCWAGDATQLYAVATSTTCVLHVGNAPVMVRTSPLSLAPLHAATEHHRRERMCRGMLLGGCRGGTGAGSGGGRVLPHPRGPGGVRRQRWCASWPMMYSWQAVDVARR